MPRFTVTLHPTLHRYYAALAEGLGYHGAHALPDMARQALAAFAREEENRSLRDKNNRAIARATARLSKESARQPTAGGRAPRQSRPAAKTSQPTT